MDKVRLGTIGSGMIVGEILKNVQRTDGVELEAVYSRSLEKGRPLAESCGCRKVYTDMDGFLSDERVNVVYIATPNLLHYEQAKRALLAGKHVLLEKPFVTRLSQAQELADLAAERGLILAEAAPTSYLPNYAVLRRELPRIGRIRLVLSNYSQYSSRYDTLLRGELPNIFNPAYAGGALMDINYYNVLLNVLLFGTPKSAAYYPNLHQGMIDTSGSVLLEYEDFVSTNTGAKDTWGVNFFQIEGENGFLYVENGSNGLQSVRVVTRGSDEVFNEQPDPSRWYYEVQALTKLLLAEDRAFFRARMGKTLETAALMERLRRGAGLVFPGDE